jgi:4-hydroxyphenylacetate 3-monooxygenase
MGRSPDHVAGFLTGFAAGSDVFGRAGEKYRRNVENYYAYVRDNDLYVSYVIIPPQIDRSKPAHQQADPTLYAGVVEENDAGIIISGAQMLGTGAALSNEVLLSCVVPLRPGDENYALSLAVPIASPGVRMMVRRPYAANAPSVYDYPLSSRFDETDALLIFDKVFVPWERVFVYRDINLTSAQWFQTGAHYFGNHQAQVRFCSKAEFLIGLATRIAEVNGTDKMPNVQSSLGELASYCSMAKGLVLASETECIEDKRGFVYPNPTYVHANMWLQATYYTTMLNYLRDLSGAGVIGLPSSFLDYENPEIAKDINRFIQSPGTPSKERTKLFKLAWEMIGSEFAGRHQQYELFYAGSRFLTTSIRMYRAFDFESAKATVARCLAGYDFPTSEYGPKHSQRTTDIL